MPPELLLNLSLTFISILMSWLAGAFTTFIVFNDEISLPEFIGFSYSIGSGITGALLYISSVTLGKFYPSFVYAFITVSGMISLILWFNGKRLQGWKTLVETKPFKYYEYLLLLPVILIIAVVISGGISGAPNWDGLLIYGFMAKSLFLSNTINMGFFTDATKYCRIHLDYPLLLPLLEYWCYHFIGKDNHQLIQFIPISYYISLACIFYGSARRILPRPIALLSLMLVLYNPIIISNSVSGDADIIVAVYLTGVLIAYSKLIVRPSIKTALMLGMLTGFLANAKNEGFAFFVMFSFLLIFIPAISKKTWIYYFIPSAILGLPWFITKLFYGIRSDLFVNVSRQIPLIKDRIPILFGYFFHFFTGTFPQVKGTGFVWLIILIGFITMLVYRSARNRYGMLWVPFILLFFIYSFVYILTPHTIKWQLDLSFSRTMTQLAPPLLWMSFAILWERYGSHGTNLQDGPEM